MAEISWRPLAGAAATTGGTIPAPAFSGTPPVQQIAIHTLPVGNVTGVIMAAGAVDGDEVVIINRSAFTITFAASGTSRVASGTGAVVAALSGMRLKWVQLDSLWYVIGKA